MKLEVRIEGDKFHFAYEFSDVEKCGGERPLSAEAFLLVASMLQRCLNYHDAETKLMAREIGAEILVALEKKKKETPHSGQEKS